MQSGSCSEADQLLRGFGVRYKQWEVLAFESGWCSDRDEVYEGRLIGISRSWDVGIELMERDLS